MPSKLLRAGHYGRDVRLRQAVNFAIDRDELIRDVKGNGAIIPALVPVHAFGYDPDLLQKVQH